jgi:hypothetical protein
MFCNLLIINNLNNLEPTIKNLQLSLSFQRNLHENSPNIIP